MTTDQAGIPFADQRLDRFWQFVCERQQVWHRRFVECKPPPWTNDPIMQRERFTNIYRELDPGTRYAISNILERDANKADKLFNLMLYRLIGRAETHAAIGFQHVDGFDPSHLRHALQTIRTAGRSPFTAAYMVSAYRQMGTNDKIENVVRLFDRLHQHFQDLYDRVASCTSAAMVHAELCHVYGFGNFLAYQVLVDLLYPLATYDGAPLLPYSHDDWACAGPGAKRGIALLLTHRTNGDGLRVMRWLRDHQHREFSRLGLAFPYQLSNDDTPVELSLANIQNSLCEFHKYVKISEGSGRGRRKFVRPIVAVQMPLV